MKRHEQTQSLMKNAMHLGMFYKVNIAAQLDEGYSEEVDKNRYISSKRKK